MKETFQKLNKTSYLNVCGEGGEYETITLDCPMFKKEIIM
jgi:diphthine-ammonia ligase